MNASPPLNLVGIGLFPLAEAARLAQIDLRTARRWALGYPYTYRGEHRQSPGVMPLALAPFGKQHDLTFPEMLTLRLVGAFRKAGLGLPVIKRVSQVAAEHYGLPLPFVSRRFRTDGRKIFLELRTKPESEEAETIPPRERRIIEVLTGQENFAEVVEPSLFANVDWEDDLASRWWPLRPDHAVVLDPAVMFGAPHISGTSVPTGAVASAVKAEGGGQDAIASVAEWFGIPEGAVVDSVQFETEWLKQAA
jgi:hypothetical protein